MTRFLSKLKSKFLWVILTLSLLCFALAFFTACGEEKKDVNPPTYSDTESDTFNDLVNGSFEYDVSGLAFSDYPKTTSFNGWGSVETDNSSTSSNVYSGVINVNDEAWPELLKTLYKNNAFLSYAENKCGFKKSDYVDKVKNDHPDWSDEQIEEEVMKEIIENEFQNSEKLNFTNPKTHADALGTKIYMLNNYVTNAYGQGTAGKVSSSTTITLNKGEYGKITFWVNTKNLETVNTDPNAKIGANIRIKNSFNSTSLSDYVIYGIDTEGVWKQYSLYVKADDFYSNTLSVCLGLGIGNGKNMTQDYCEGTVFFDDVVYTKLTVDEFNTEVKGKTAEETKFNYTNDKNIYKNINDLGSKYYLYNMVFTESEFDDSTFQKSIDLGSSTITKGYTESKSTGKTSKDITKVDESSATVESNKITVEVKNASYHVKLDDSKFKVKPQEYIYLTFKVDNQLKDFDANGISAYIYDVNPKDSADYKATPFNSLKTSGDKTTFTLLVKNTFKTGDPRPFFIDFIVGPVDFKDLTNANGFSTGTVTLSDFYYYTGNINQYKEGTHEETDNYKYYEMFSNTADFTATLCQGSTEPSDDSLDTYNLNVAPSDYGKIKTEITNVQCYTGVTADSILVKGNEGNKEINTRKVKGDYGYAGLINSKYAKEGVYGEELKDFYNGEKNIQAIVINNKEADSYGFIGENFTISKSTADSKTYAKVSVKVKVVGDAKAFIYLVDCSTGSNKEVKTMNFTGNIENYNKGTVYSNSLMFEGIDSTTTEATENGWLTVTFYIASGASDLNLRLEMWNGSRSENGIKSQGTVFFTLDKFNDADTFEPMTTSGAFTEPENIETAFSTSGNPLGDNFNKGDLKANSVYYTRELDKREQRFNKEQKDADKKVTYSPSYVWAKSQTSDCTMIYAVYNTIDPVKVDPYEKQEEEKADSGCAGTDPSTFWLSFSTILLAVVLVVAIVALVIKNVRRKKKANANDAKTHYKVSSRYKATKEKKKEKALKQSFDEYEDDVKQDNSNKENNLENTSNDVVEEKETENSDEYVYGDVQDFGNSENANEVPEEQEQPVTENEKVEADVPEQTEVENTSDASTENAEKTEEVSDDKTDNS